MTGRELLDYLDNESEQGRVPPPAPKTADDWKALDKLRSQWAKGSGDPPDMEDPYWLVYFGSSRFVHEAALWGRLAVKGRLKDQSKIQPIPQDYWVTATIDLISNYFADGEAFTVPKDFKTPTYELLRFPRDQVVELWPPAPVPRSERKAVTNKKHLKWAELAKAEVEGENCPVYRNKPNQREIARRVRRKGGFEEDPVTILTFLKRNPDLWLPLDR